jgi:Uma2 family endonuclease
MTALDIAQDTIETVANLLERLGGISPDRVRMKPPPGTATEADLIATTQREGHACELVDGVLVEKAMGFEESILAGLLLSLLRAFIYPRKLGVVSGADGMMRLFPGLVRIPDVAFASWNRIPGRRFPRVPIAGFAPDLAVEVLSGGNTPAEMARKRQEYFSAGVRLVWLVDPVARTVTVFTQADQSTVLGEGETLEGGDVLPGFALPLRDYFSELDLTG